jgi:hypothetical protein
LISWFDDRFDDPQIFVLKPNVMARLLVTGTTTLSSAAASAGTKAMKVPPQQAQTKRRRPRCGLDPLVMTQRASATYA